MPTSAFSTDWTNPSVPVAPTVTPTTYVNPLEDPNIRTQQAKESMARFNKMGEAGIPSRLRQGYNLLENKYSNIMNTLGTEQNLYNTTQGQVNTNVEAKRLADIEAANLKTQQDAAAAAAAAASAVKPAPYWQAQNQYNFMVPLFRTDSNQKTVDALGGVQWKDSNGIVWRNYNNKTYRLINT